MSSVPAPHRIRPAVDKKLSPRLIAGMTIQPPKLHAYSSASTARLQATPAGYDRFRRDALGLSVHFGLYSIDGQAEWYQAVKAVPSAEYAERIEQFNPTRFDADEWIGTAADAGVTAFMVTTKHHDGFCLFDSKLTDFSSMHAPIGGDLIAELAEACHKRDIALHLYYSLIDWHHPLAGLGHNKPPADFPGYCQFMLGQLRELCTGYGHIAGFLFDGWWPEARAYADQAQIHRQTHYPYGEMFDLIHTLQPDAMVTNNHHILPVPGEDYQVWEIEIPGEKATGFNCDQIGDRPLAAWITSTANGWSWQPAREDYRTPQEAADLYARARAAGASMFLNMGPMNDGQLNPREVELLRGMAALIEK